MRAIVIGAALAMAAAGPAFAQGAGGNGQPGPGTILLVPAQTGQADSGAAAAANPGPAPAGGGMNMGAEHMRHMAWMRAQLGGSSFRFRRGRSEIDIHCGADQPLPVCISAAAALMDKIDAMHGQPGDAEQQSQPAPGMGGQGSGGQGSGSQGGGTAGGATANPQR